MESKSIFFTSIAKMFKGLEYPFCEEKLRELGLCSLEKTKEEISLMCAIVWREAVKKMELGSLQWCPVIGQEAMGTNWNAEGSS